MEKKSLPAGRQARRARRGKMREEVKEVEEGKVKLIYE